MNKRRLLKLADLLDADAKNKKGIKFDMYGWGRVGNHKAPLSCCTSACAMGLAAISGAFKRAGLSADISNMGRVKFRWKNQHDLDGFDVATRLFQIDNHTAINLFSAGVRESGNIGAKAERTKAKQIRRFVATGEL